MSDQDQDTGPPDGLVHDAWVLIANAWEGDWTKAPTEWQEAAAQWRDGYHDLLDTVRAGEDEEVRHG